MKVCPNCGAENNDGSRFCETCGADLSKVQGTGGDQQPVAAAPSASTSWQAAGGHANQSQVPPAQPYQGAAPQYAYPMQQPQQKSGVGKILLGVLIGVVGVIVVCLLLAGRSTGSSSTGGSTESSSYDGTWVYTNTTDNGKQFVMTIDGSDVDMAVVESGKIEKGTELTGVLKADVITWRDDGNPTWTLELKGQDQLVVTSDRLSEPLTFDRQES